MKSLLLIFFAALTAAYATILVADVTCPPPSGDTPSYLPDTTNCSRFYECVGVVPKLLECPPGLIFNPNDNVCDFTWDYNCTYGDKIEKIIKPVSPLFRLSPNPPYCPPPNVNDTQPIHPDTSNCSRYYECSNGLAISRDCPPGLLFDKNLLVCTFEWDAQCAKEESILDKIRKIKTFPLKLNDDKICPRGAQIPVRANPKNCSTYHLCSNGTPVLMNCPAGTLFDKTLLVCTWASQARCAAVQEA